MFYKLTKNMKVESETPAGKHLFTDNETYTKTMWLKKPCKFYERTVIGWFYDS